MTVKEQLIYYGVLKGLKETEINKKMDDLLKEFDIINAFDLNFFFNPYFVKYKNLFMPLIHLP